MLRTISLILSAAIAMIVVSCGGTGNAEPKAGDVVTKAATKSTIYVTMPESTAITVTLIDSIDTDVQVTGAAFRATLARAIVAGGHTLFADGAQAKGILSKVVESGRLKTPAELNFSLTEIQDQNGRWVDIGTKTIMDKRASHTTREVAMIGGGALIGGIIGKIIDKKGSTEIGAVAGAAAGTGLSLATGKQDIYYGPGTVITFFSNQSKQIALR